MMISFISHHVLTTLTSQKSQLNSLPKSISWAHVLSQNQTNLIYVAIPQTQKWAVYNHLQIVFGLIFSNKNAYEKALWLKFILINKLMTNTKFKNIKRCIKSLKNHFKTLKRNTKRSSNKKKKKIVREACGTNSLKEMDLAVSIENIK